VTVYGRREQRRRNQNHGSSERDLPSTSHWRLAYQTSRVEATHAKQCHGRCPGRCGLGCRGRNGVAPKATRFQCVGCRQMGGCFLRCRGRGSPGLRDHAHPGPATDVAAILIRPSGPPGFEEFLDFRK
jgi:hypothetical protein